MMKYKYLLLLIVAVNSTALFGGIMEPDSALYAYIAKQMAQNNDFINLYNNTDWLDKPHFPFWITAASFKIFAINAFAYKLPAFLFWLAGAIYLYKLGKKIYNEKTATLALVIYTTALQVTVGLFDVRAEHYLTALTVASIYYLYQLYETGKFQYVLLAALFSASAIMTKGIFILITILSGIAVLMIIKKEWKHIADYKWYLYLLLTFIFILPELYCLYVQFDIQKVVYGKTNASGLRFFFWDSQFGRFFNTGPIKGKGTPFFFFHTILWAFLPWSILLYIAIVRLIRKRNVIYKSEQWIIIISLAVTFLIFSLSKFQLPHYVIILFPQCALICADYLIGQEQAKRAYSCIVLQALLLIVCLLMLQTVAVIFGIHGYGWIILIATISTPLIYLYSRQNSINSVIYLSIGFFIFTQLFLNLFFYPALLKYQSGETAAKWFNKEIKSPLLGLYRTENFSLKFYANSKIIATETLPAILNDSLPVKYYFTTKKNADSLTSAGFPIITLKSFENFHITKLSTRFLYKDTRSSQLDSTVIFKLN